VRAPETELLSDRQSTTTGNPTRAGVQTTDTLFDPLQLGRYSLRHRILDGPADPIARAPAPERFRHR
jgi:hypothetical protein